MTGTFRVIVYLYATYAQFVQSSTVTTRYGKIQGIHENGVAKFLGIPYKTYFRFPKESLELSNFTGTYQAKTFKHACPQDRRLLNETVNSLFGNLTKELNVPSAFSEDCLYLNIYVPGSVNTSISLPVMVYIHGGGFQIGSGQIFDPSELVKTGDVIVVTFDYRLGALGFLSIFNNTGLRDQNHALKWVKDNINSFGGDPNKVTIFGEGTGGIAVGLHIVSLESRGLFNRAISMGGTALQSEFMYTTPENITNEFLRTVGCSVGSEVIECITNINLELILEAQKNLSLQGHVFLPFIDGQFVPAVPQHLIETGQFAKVDYIIGFNNDAETMYSQLLPMLLQLTTGISEEEYQQTVSNRIITEYKNNYKAIFDTIIFEYQPTASKNLSKNQIWLRQLMSILRDATAAQLHTTQIHHSAFGGKVFSYFFDQIPSFSEHSPLILMAGSGMELVNVFGLLENDRISENIMKAWTNFATYGDPNLTTENGQWPLFNATTKQFVQFKNELNHSSLVLDTYPGKLEKRLSFWTKLLPALQEATSPCEERPAADDGAGTIVSLNQGLLRGERKQLKDYVWEQFIEIPYAESPVGALRWRPPNPHTGWSGIRNSSITFGKVCPQGTLQYGVLPGEETEDCLFLDVFVPNAVKYVRYQKLPVMLFIHGGGIYTIGSKAVYHGGALSQYGVIVVTINYRLGVLGFLSTGDTAAPGNFGLMDQHLAIQWTKKNIENFGGDPNKITIFGESAGGASVILQMISPKNKGLFKNVIAESGSPFSYWALDRFGKVKKSTFLLGEKVSCPTTDSQLMVSCLRKSSWKDITRDWLDMLPVIDGEFIPKVPEELYQENATQNFNLMTGTNKDEGFFFRYALGRVLKEKGARSTNNPEAVTEAFKYIYADLLNTDTESIEYTMKGSDMLTDYWYSAGTDRDARLHSKHGGKTYRYFFQFKPTLSIFAHGSPDWVQGSHVDELIYVFGWPELISRGLSFQAIDLALPENYTANNFTYPERDLMVSRHIMTLWTNFATTGDPNKGLELPGFNWPLFTDEHPDILKLSANLSQLGYNSIITPSSASDLLRPDKVAFWNKLVPSLELKTLQQCPVSDNDTENRGTEPSTTDGGEKVTGKPNDDDDDAVACTSEIGPLKLTKDQANDALWVLGVISGILLVVLIVVSCKLILVMKTYKKLNAGFDKSSVQDNIGMISEHRL